MNLKQLFCQHTELSVVRWHPDVVEPDMVGKELYRDELGVANFIRCRNCKKIFKGVQRESLWRANDIDPVLLEQIGRTKGRNG